MITNNRNDSLKAIVSSFNLLPNLARDFKTIRRSLSKITGIKPSITEDSKTKDGKGISPTLVGADDKKKSEGGGLLNSLLLLKLASFGQKKKFLKSPIGKAFRKFRKVNKSIKSIQKTLLSVVKKVFSPKNIIKVLSKLALPLVIVGSLFQGLTAGFDAYKETGSIWESFKATVGGVVEFLTFGLIDKEMVGKFYQGIADFIKPVTDAIGKIYASIKEYVGEKVDGVKTFFGMKVEPKVTKPVIEQPSKEELEKQAKAQEEIEKAKKEEREKQYEGEDEIVRKRLKLQEKSAKKLQEEEDERRAKAGKPTPAPAPAPAPAAAAPAPAPAAAAPAAAPAKAPSKDKKPSATEDMTGKAKEVGKAIEEAGITSPSAVQALVATAAKESGLDPKSKEIGAKGWLNTLSGRGLSYIYNKFPQLGPGGRVAKLLGMPNGVPADYLQSAWSKGDEAFFEMVYGGSSTNPQAGDGYKFRGRGFIQITGRNVYKNIGKAMGENFESNPDAVSSDFGAAAKAMVGYIVNSVGQGNSKKGFDFLNSLTDFKTALKVIIGNVAMGNLGSNMEKIESAYTTSKLAATNVGQLDAAAKYENIAKASTDVASGQRQQAKPSTPVNINASTTNNTKINKNEMAAASKPRDTAGMLAARAT